MLFKMRKDPGVIDIYNELRVLTDSLEKEGIQYALCGGLAMAVHGHVRATVDIDLLILAEELESVFRIAAKLGYGVKAEPMELAGGKVVIHRVTKLFSETEDYLSVDLILAEDEMKPVWESRQKVKLEQGDLTVVSREGLIDLKQLRGSKQDLADIDHLKGGGGEA